MPSRNPIVCGRKFCTGCGRWRLIVDFSARRRDPLLLRARCHACERVYMRGWVAANADRVRAHQREYWQRNIETKRAYSRAYQRKRRTDPATREKAREADRRAWLAMRNDPVRWAKRLEDQRMDYRMRAERKGKPIQPVSEKTYANGNGSAWVGGHLSTEPLARAIDEWLGEFGGRSLTHVNPQRHEVTGAGLTQLAEISGVSDRTLRDVLHGYRTKIQYATADRICVALSTPMHTLYPDLP